MNPTSLLSASAAALLLTTVPSIAEADPFTDDDRNPFGDSCSPRDRALQQTIDLDMVDPTLSDLIGFVQQRVEVPLNFVVKEPTSEVALPPMRIRNITIQTLLDTLQALAPVKISTVPASGDGAPVIVIDSRDKALTPAPRPYNLVPLPPGPPSGDDLTPRLPGLTRNPPSRVVPKANANAQSTDLALVSRLFDPGREPEPVTRAYPIRLVLETIEFDSLLDLLRKFWGRAAQDWAAKLGDDAISFHEASGMLIVKAPQPRHEELQALLEGLEKSRTAARNDNDELSRLRQRLVEYEHRLNMNIRTAEEQRAMSNETAAGLRKRLEDKEDQITTLRRAVAELENALARGQSPQ